MSRVGTYVGAIQTSANFIYGRSFGGWETDGAWSVLVVSVTSSSGNRKAMRLSSGSAEPCNGAEGLGGAVCWQSTGQQTRMVAYCDNIGFAPVD